MRPSALANTFNAYENNPSVPQQGQSAQGIEHSFAVQQRTPAVNPVFASGYGMLVPMDTMAQGQVFRAEDNFSLRSEYNALHDEMLAALDDPQFMASDWSTGALSETVAAPVMGESALLDGYNDIYGTVPVANGYADVSEADFFNIVPSQMDENTVFGAAHDSARYGMYNAGVVAPDVDMNRSFYAVKPLASVPSSHLHKFDARAKAQPEPQLQSLPPVLSFEERYPVAENFTYRNISLADVQKDSLLLSRARIDQVAQWLSLHAHEPVEQRLAFLKHVAGLKDRRVQKNFREALKMDYGLTFLMDANPAASQALISSAQNIHSGQLMPYTSVKEAMGYLTYFNTNGIDRIAEWFAVQRDADPKDKLAFFQKIEKNAGSRTKTRVLSALQNPQAAEFLKHSNLDTEAQLEKIVQAIKHSF